MMIRIRAEVRNAAGNAIVDMIDEGAIYDNGYFEIWTDPKPTSILLGSTGTLLATLNFSNPAFGDFVDGLSAANDISGDLSVDNSGVASWFRIFDRDGVVVLDGDVSELNGTGELKLNSTNLIAGGVVQIASFIIKIKG